MSMHIKLLALSLLAGLTACSSEPVRIVRDPALADAETFEVRGVESRSGRTPVTFGNFSTEQMQVGITQRNTREIGLWGWTSELFQMSEGYKDQPYRFVFLDEQGAQWQIECRANTPITIVENDTAGWTRSTGDTLLGCAARDPGATRAGSSLPVTAVSSLASAASPSRCSRSFHCTTWRGSMAGQFASPG
jgi:hypothetical protein